MTTRADLLVTTAVAEVGTTEDPPNSNRQKYGLEFGMNGVPWCSIFVWWCARRSGVVYPDTAYVPTLETWARSTGNTVTLSNIRKGDVVCLDFTPPFGDGSDHVEIALGPPDGGWVECVGGNTSNKAGESVDNGGGVYINRRPVSWIATAIRLPGSEEVIETDEQEDHHMMVTWTIPDGTRYIADSNTGASRTAQDAFPDGLSGAEIEAAVAELVKAGACKDYGALGWNANFVTRLSPTWPVQI